MTLKDLTREELEETVRRLEHEKMRLIHSISVMFGSVEHVTRVLSKVEKILPFTYKMKVVDI